jgi:SRSO17 transposase
MVADALVAFLSLFEGLRPAFTRPGFENALVVFAGWVLTNGAHAVTQALVATDVARRRHHEAFHRFFSRGTWNPDDLGLLLFDRLAKLIPGDAPIQVAIDDTLAAKKGPNAFGIGSHLDAVRSTKAFRVFCFGHVWVTLAVIVSVPFSRRPWALPVLFRLYRNKKECKAKGGSYRKKTELARDMLDILLEWADKRRIHLVMDSAYCNDTVMHDLPTNVGVVGAMRPDAVLTALPKKSRRPKRGGRPRVRGNLLPKPEALARSTRHEWESCKADIYGKTRTVHYKTICAQWYRACGARLLRIVVVHVDRGSIPIRVFFSTNPDLAVREIIETYARRWAIEVCFRDLKQLLGFSDSSARKREAVERTAPFVGYIYTMLVIWFAERIHQTQIAVPPIRPWYTHKSGLCFADVLRAAQRALAPLDVLDPARSLDNLHKLSPRRTPREPPTRREAA